MIQERHASNTDKGGNILFPKIIKVKSQLLLTYHGTSLLHSKDLKKEIIKFLLIKAKVHPSDIDSYSNTAIYFKMSKKMSKVDMKILNDLFDLYMTKFIPKGEKLFWTFNKIEIFENSPKDEVALLGFVNATYHKEFEVEIKEVVEKLSTNQRIKKILREAFKTFLD